ncbi:MAG: recombinase zinc beta ribbon domain-containing protein [Bryobacterales bacterium]|nr:recombinase zinc beta ribbon domain-containing protein [Bryobacterales bacterium]
MRLSRKRGKFASQQVGGLERPHEEWIEIPVPAMVSADQFEQAQEQLEANKRHATRRTKEPTLLQDMLVFRRCGYAYYRTATRTSKRKLYYYRCLGSDGWRYEEGVRCPSRPVRQDRLDTVVWRELVRLLDDPALIQAELQRRLEARRETDPQRRQLAEPRGEHGRLQRASATLVTAYQEALIPLDELRSRMPAIHCRKRVLETELDAIENAAEERERYLRIAEILGSFRDRLRTSAETLDVIERQKVLRSLVRDVLVGDGEITIRHSIPMTEGSGYSSGKPTSNLSRQSPRPQRYLLRWGSPRSPLRGAFPLPACPVRAALSTLTVVLFYGHFQPQLDPAQHPLVAHAPRN